MIKADKEKRDKSYWAEKWEKSHHRPSFPSFSKENYVEYCLKKFGGI